MQWKRRSARLTDPSSRSGTWMCINIRNHCGAAAKIQSGCCLLRKDRTERWFLISAKADFDDSGRFEGSSACLRIQRSERNGTALGGRRTASCSSSATRTAMTRYYYPNRRRFDAMLEHEYTPLRRSHPRLFDHTVRHRPLRNTTISTARWRGANICAKSVESWPACIQRSVRAWRPATARGWSSPVFCRTLTLYPAR